MAAQITDFKRVKSPINMTIMSVSKIVVISVIWLQLYFTSEFGNNFAYFDLLSTIEFGQQTQNGRSSDQLEPVESPRNNDNFSNFNNDHQSSAINFISGRNFVTIPARIYEIIIKVGHRTNVAMVTFNYPSPINQIRRQLNNDSF